MISTIISDGIFVINHTFLLLSLTLNTLGKKTIVENLTEVTDVDKNALC